MLTTQESTRTGNMKNEESSNLRRRSPRNTRDGKVCKSKLQEAGAGTDTSEFRRKKNHGHAGRSET
jgi:hypothetical protein